MVYSLASHDPDFHIVTSHPPNPKSYLTRRQDATFSSTTKRYFFLTGFFDRVEFFYLLLFRGEDEKNSEMVYLCEGGGGGFVTDEPLFTGDIIFLL